MLGASLTGGRELRRVAPGALWLALCLAACGGTHLTSAARPLLSPPRHAGRGYRWLVRTAGTPPTIAQENRARGTRGWRLAGPPAQVGGIATGTVRGYVTEPALAPGQMQSIDVSAPGSPTVTIQVYRMGWYGGSGGHEVLAAPNLPVEPQPGCRHLAATGLTECRWHPTLRFRIPPALPSGVYIARLSARTGASDCLFVVRAKQPQPLLAQLPTATYQAYNAWGGDSLYPGGRRVQITGTTQGVAVSYDRPYDSLTGAGQFFSRDVAMVRFLERYGYPVSYTTSESVDRDPGQVYGHRALIDFGHSEYWSARQARAFARAAHFGTSLLFFGSDTLSWRVRFQSGGARGGQPGHTMVADKRRVGGGAGHAAPAGVFPDRGAGLTGSVYTGCITPRLPGAGPPVYRYYGWTAARQMRPRWLFAGSGVSSTVPIPGIVGYELDQPIRGKSSGVTRIGGGVAPCQSGVAAEPGLPAPGFSALADTTLRRLRSGALVFDTGTLGWELGLAAVPSASPDAPRAPDPPLVRMTRNLLGHVLRRP